MPLVPSLRMGPASSDCSTLCDSHFSFYCLVAVTLSLLNTLEDRGSQDAKASMSVLGQNLSVVSTRGVILTTKCHSCAPCQVLGLNHRCQKPLHVLVGTQKESLPYSSGNCQVSTLLRSEHPCPGTPCCLSIGGTSCA